MCPARRARRRPACSGRDAPSLTRIPCTRRPATCRGRRRRPSCPIRTRMTATRLCLRQKKCPRGSRVLLQILCARISRRPLGRGTRRSAQPATVFLESCCYHDHAPAAKAQAAVSLISKTLSSPAASFCLEMAPPGSCLTPSPRPRPAGFNMRRFFSGGPGAL